MARRDAIVIGIQGNVLALDASTGTELWRTALKGAQFVNVAVQGGTIVATTKGEVFALDSATGQILWNNRLKGLGTSFVTIAGAEPVSAIALKKQQDDGAAAAAGAAAS